MPERKNYFPQAENEQYNVLNVLSDKPYRREEKTTEEASIKNDGAQAEDTILDGIDPNMRVVDYMENLIDEEEALEEESQREEEQTSTQGPQDPHKEGVNAVFNDMPEDILKEVLDDNIIQGPAETSVNVSNPVIQKQADEARQTFIEDLYDLDEEPAIKRLHQGALDERPDEPLSLHHEEVVEEKEEEEDIEQNVSRIRKPRFAKKKAQDDIKKTQQVEEQTKVADILETPEEKEEKAEDAPEEKDIYEEELAQALEAQKKNDSICDDLRELERHLEEAKSPMLHKTEVLVPREKTLRLISSLTAICDVNPDYLEGAAEEDFLIDRLVSGHSKDDYKPLERAYNRAQAIIADATQKADIIVSDAKTLSAQILAETETEIKSKYDEADERIALHLTTAKTESSKKLSEARSELTTSRQRSVEILSKYLEKAESDYQGYWERAEHTVMASLEQSESILAKAEDIYKKELDVIKQDREEIEEILESLKRHRKFH